MWIISEGGAEQRTKRGKKKKKKSERPSVLISEGGAREDFGYSQGPQTLP